MARRNLSLPHERRKAQLMGRSLSLQVQIAERKEKLAAAKQELAAMRPKKTTPAI